MNEQEELRDLLDTWDSLVGVWITLHSAMSICNQLPEPSKFKDFECSNEILSNAQKTISDVAVALSKAQDNDSELDSDDEKEEEIKNGNEAWEALLKQVPSIEEFYYDALEEWSSKVNLVDKCINKTKFKELDTSAKAQVKASMINQEKLKQRTTLNRIKAKPLSEIEQTRYDFIYDDNDFFSLTLRDVANKQSKLDVGRIQEEISAKLSASLKKQGERKSVKGRALEFVVHDKIINYSTPQPMPPGSWPQDRIEEFVSTILGRVSEVDVLPTDFKIFAQ